MLVVAIEQRAVEIEENGGLFALAFRLSVSLAVFCRAVGRIVA